MLNEKDNKIEDLMPLLNHPSLPDNWDYKISVEKMKRLIYKWKNMTRDMANELWIAREKLKVERERDSSGTFVTMDKSWSGYCDEIGIAKITANRWLDRWFPETLSLGNKPIVKQADYRNWLPVQPQCDLLFTDPPYATDVEDVYSFAFDWLPLGLNKVKSTGRAYVCIGAYPNEIEAYLIAAKKCSLKLQNILVWTYQNTLGPSPLYDYKLNWQAILYFKGLDAPPLNCSSMIEQFTVQNIAAPDGRQGDRYHEWQKPLELAERLLKHSTKEDDIVIDPFVGTGTFILAANKHGRSGYGCDIDNIALDIAIKRGCKIDES